MTIFRKSLITLGLVTFALAAALIVSVLVFMNSLYYETNARALSKTASAMVSVYSEEALSSFFNNGTNNRDFSYYDNHYRLTLIDKSGEVLWDSRVVERIVNHLDREEVRAALEGREGKALRSSLSTGTRQLYAALPVEDAGGEIVGVFRLSVEVPSFWQRVSSAVLPFLFLAGILVLAAYMGILYYSRSLSLSLDRLVDITLDAGEFKYADTDMGEAEEIVTLEKALRSMSSELKLRLNEAKTESRRLEAILNSMSEAVIAMDNNLLLLMINPCARDLFNLGNRSIWKLPLLEATRSTELEWAGRKVLESLMPQEMELSIHSNGMVRRFRVSITPFSSAALSSSGANGNGTCAGIVIVMDDLTHITRLEQIRKDFVANVSHELRTPIQIIKGFSETLLEMPLVVSMEGEAAETKQLRHYIEIIRKNTVVMENLVSDLLSLASLEDENGTRPDREVLFLSPLFTEAIALVENQARKYNSSITVDCSPDLKAKLYGSFIVQALVNLLDNAIKYSASPSQVYVRALREGNSLILEVEDNGIGIPSEHMERIFERFYRVDGARSKEAGGTGLGLSIVRHIAILHSGTVEVESHAGEGSVFRLKIPD